MKIRHPMLIKALGFAVGWLVRLWIGTLRYRYRPMGANLDPNQPNLRGRYLYAFWHENILVPAYHYGRRDIHVLISQHADGQLIAEACRHLGFRVVRGSATRGGARAIRQMQRLSRSAHLAITPDGPRGPRRKVQPGVVYLAALTGLPIVPFGVAFARAWRSAQLGPLRRAASVERRRVRHRRADPRARERRQGPARTLPPSGRTGHERGDRSGGKKSSEF